MNQISDYFVVGAISEGEMETMVGLDDGTAYHASGYVDAVGQICVCLEKLPTLPLEPVRVGNDGRGLRDYTGSGYNIGMELGVVERPVTLWDGEACGLCKIGSQSGYCDVVGCPAQGRKRIGESTASIEVMVSSCIMVSVQRVALALAPEDADPWGTIPVRISACGYDINMDVNLSMCVDHELLVSGAEKLLADFFAPPAGGVPGLLSEVQERALVESEPDRDWGDGNVTTMVPCQAKDGVDEEVVSVASGRGRDVGYEEDGTRGFGPPTAVDDFLFLRGGSAADKSKSVASVVLCALKRLRESAEAVVVVLGDCPGVIAREIARCEYRVLGIDTSERHLAPTGWEQWYRCVSARVTSDVTRGEVEGWLDRAGWGGRDVSLVIADIDQGARRTSVEDSALNRTAAMAMHEAWPDSWVVVRSRGVPVAPLDVLVLDTRWHEPDGAELYWAFGVGADVLGDTCAYRLVTQQRPGHPVDYIMEMHNERWKSYTSDVLRIGADPPPDEDPSRPPPPVSVRFSGTDGFLACFTLRNGIEARALSSTAFMRAGSRARGVIELMGLLRPYVERYRPGRIAELVSKFQPSDRHHTRHVSRATIEASPTCIATMQVRYDELLRLCNAAPERSQSGEMLGDLSRLPGFGAYFWWSHSRIRDELQVANVYLAFDRVLPLAAMPILASRAWVTMVSWLLRAHDRLMGKPLHTWELQALLWSLSHLGTEEERQAYFVGRLVGAVDLLLTSRRRGQRTEPAATAELGRTLASLEALGCKSVRLGAAERVALEAQWLRAGRGKFVHDQDYSRLGPGVGPRTPSRTRRQGSVSSVGSTSNRSLRSPPPPRNGNVGAGYRSVQIG